MILPPKKTKTVEQQTAASPAPVQIQQLPVEATAAGTRTMLKGLFTLEGVFTLNDDQLDQVALLVAQRQLELMQQQKTAIPTTATTPTVAPIVVKEAAVVQQPRQEIFVRHARVDF